MAGRVRALSRTDESVAARSCAFETQSYRVRLAVKSSFGMIGIRSEVVASRRQVAMVRRVRTEMVSASYSVFGLGVEK